MKLKLSGRADKQYIRATPIIQRAFLKQSDFLKKDLHHPSLHAKKFGSAENYWQARVNRSWRFYFVVQEDVYWILSIEPHS